MKLRIDGNTLERHKPGLVTEGRTQKFGAKTFYADSFVTTIATIHSSIALATSFTLIVHYRDVTIKFCNDGLENGFTMVQHRNFVVLSNEHKVCESKYSF